MPARDEQLLELLQDTRFLGPAYAASSDYVMRLSFERIRELQAFRGRTELASDVLKQYGNLVRKVRDPVVLGAHLYALELTGARDAVRKAVVAALGQKELRQDPMLAQTAGKIAARLLGRRLPRGKDLNEQELDAIEEALSKEAKL